MLAPFPFESEGNGRVQARIDHEPVCAARGSSWCCSSGCGR